MRRKENRTGKRKKSTLLAKNKKISKKGQKSRKIRDRSPEVEE